MLFFNLDIQGRSCLFVKKARFYT